MADSKLTALPAATIPALTDETYIVQNPGGTPVSTGSILRNLPYVQSVNARAYGATGNGTTDDTTALQNWLNAAAGFVAYLPAGTYLYSADLVVPSNTVVIGDGRGSILQAKGVNTNVANGFKLNNVSGVLIARLQINGNKANIDQTGAGATYTTKQGIYVTGGSADVIIEDCCIHDCFAGGVLADNASGLTVRGNLFYNNGDNAVFLRSGPTTPWTAPSNCTIVNNTVHNGTYSGIGLVKASLVTISNNICYSNGPTAGQGSGITIEGSTYVTCNGNVCHDNGVNGIDVRYSNEGSGANVASSQVNVTGNNCYNNGYGTGYGNAGGIVTEGATELLVQGNDCNHNDNGINISAGNGLDPSKVLVQGNVCRANALIGLRFYAAAAQVDLVADGNYVADNGSDQFTASVPVLLKGGLIARPTTSGKENVHLLAGSSGSVIQGVKITDPIDNGILIDNTVAGVLIRDCVIDKAAGTGGRGVYEANTTGAATLVESCKFLNFTFQDYAFNNPASYAINCRPSTTGGAQAQDGSFFNVTPVAQPTTAGGASAFTQNAGNAVNDASTFDGYTLKQVVKALRNLGLLN